MTECGEGQKARMRAEVVRALSRRPQRKRISARLRMVAGDELDPLADLRRLVEDRPPRSWHL